mmetsp:Transcript_7630/g.16523  ORF Transcript_7630/g.16523 Transcript_7630/m.16523 type:complete len:237 (+) Transcript_7630:38-748(+)
MPAKRQRIGRIHGNKQIDQSPWRQCLRLFLVLSIAGLLFIGILLSLVAWESDLENNASSDTNNNNRGGSAGDVVGVAAGTAGTEAMLKKNFVKSSKKEPIDGNAAASSSMRGRHEKYSERKTIHNARKEGATSITTINTTNDDKYDEKKKQIIIDNQQPIDKLIDRSHRIKITDTDRTLAFVHIGKSGGSTISLLLRNGCMASADHYYDYSVNNIATTKTITKQHSTPEQQQQQPN